MLKDVQKSAIDLAISLNPCNVSITRVVYEEKDGALEKDTPSVADQVWLVYPKITNTSVSKKRTDGGHADASLWSALAPSTADIKHGAYVQDTVEAIGIGTFAVEKVSPIMIGEQLNGYVVQLKMVS